MNKLISLLLASVCFVGCGLAEEQPAEAKSVVTQINLLNDDGYYTVNFGEAAFMRDFKALMDEAEKSAVEVFQGKDVVGRISVTVPKGKGTLEVTVKTLPDDPDGCRALEKKLNGRQFAKAKFMDAKFVLSFAVGEGKGEWKEEILSVRDMRSKAFQAADMAGKLKIIQNFAKEECIPVAAAYMVKVDDQFKGVKETGKVMQSLDLGKRIDVSKTLDNNVNYWRGMMEMTPGNCLVVCSRPFLHAANGDLDHALNYLNLHLSFADEEAVASQLMAELRDMISVHHEELNQQVDKGIGLHDAGKYDEAIKFYGELLKVYPGSAFATYEIWFAEKTKNLMDKDKGGNRLEDEYDDWGTYKHKVYKLNPLYNMDVQANTPEGMYLMMRRMKLRELKLKSAKDVVEYVDIAFDLEVYPFSNEFYWVIQTRFKDEVYGGRDLMNWILYGIDAVGAGSISELLGKDLDAAKKIVEADSKKRFEQSPFQEEKKK